MSEWWTYSLSNFLLFSPRTYRRLFELYNAQWWPLHLLAMAIGAVVLALVWRDGARRLRWAAFALAPCWAWIGAEFMARHYASINWAASTVALAFGAQTLLLVSVAAFVRVDSSSSSRRSPRIACLALMLFGLLLQPLIGLLLGRPWHQLELFGMTPDPTTSVTLGLLAVWPRGSAAWLLWIVPLAWCLFDAATLWAMHDADAAVMPLLAALALAIAASSARRL